MSARAGPEGLAKTRASKTGLQLHKKRPQFRVQEWAGNTFCYHVGRRGLVKAGDRGAARRELPAAAWPRQQRAQLGQRRQGGITTSRGYSQARQAGRKLCRSCLHDRRKLLLEGSVTMIRMVGRPAAVRGLLRRRADPLTRVQCFKSKLLALRSKAHI